MPNARVALLLSGALATLVALAVPAPRLIAQHDARREPKRPRLGELADTNDATAYYDYGRAQLVANRAPNAADAFYWAMRLDPTRAEYPYARRVALLLSSDPRRYMAYLAHDRSAIDTKELRAADSLMLRAYAIDPFLYRRFDRMLLQWTLEASVVARHPGIDRAALNIAILDFVQHAHLSGLMAYAEGRFPDALKYYADLVDQDKQHSYGAHAERARIFYLIGNYDSARSEMTEAVARMRERNEKELVYLYDSKAIYEEAIGLTEEHLDAPGAAREAYGRALAEDLAFYPAHVRLAQLDLAAGDTAAAVNEMDVAVQLGGDDPWLRYAYGYLLIGADHDSAATVQFQQALAADPHFAMPHQMLGRLADAHNQTASAIEHYNAYLARAPRSDPQYAWTRARLTTLAPTVTSKP